MHLNRTLVSALLVGLFALVLVSIQAVVLVSASSSSQQKSWPIDASSSSSSTLDERSTLDNGEQVDRLSSAAGDLFWRSQLPQEQQADWFRQQQQQPVGIYYTAGLDGGPTRNYHALIDEFKQISSLANPTRESRAFKPRLMSTARGFGKRSYMGSDGPAARHITYGDLLAAAAAANQNNGKMSGNALR